MTMPKKRKIRKSPDTPALLAQSRHYPADTKKRLVGDGERATGPNKTARYPSPRSPAARLEWHESRANVDSRAGVPPYSPPAQIAHLVRGSVINLSGASDFYKKKAHVATLLADLVEPLSNCRYRFKGGFAPYYFENLRFYLQPSDRRSVADNMAEALFALSKNLPKIDYGRLPIGSTPTDEFLRGAWKGADEWDAFLRRNARIGRGWINEMSDDGTVRNWSGEFHPDVFDLFIRFGNDTKKPPTLSIDVKGKAVALFMDFWMTLNLDGGLGEHPRREELRNKAGIVLDAIVKLLKTNLTILRPEKGRPSSRFGEQAAYLLDHQKKTIVQVANELCDLPLEATSSARRQCFDRIRKAATNYYRHLSSDFFTFDPERVRRTIYHVPGNVDPVKSE
jgi:hypothetical protein